MCNNPNVDLVNMNEYAKDNHYAGSQQVTVGAQRVYQGQSLCRKSAGHSGSSKSIPRTITMQEVSRSQWELKEYTKDNHYAGSHQVTVGAQRVYQGQSLCRKSPGHSGSSKSIPRTITMQEVTRSQWELKEYTKDNHYAGSHQVTVGAQRVYQGHHYTGSHQVTVGAQRVYQGQSLCRKSAGHSGSSKSMSRTITMQEDTRSQWVLKEYAEDNHYAGSQQVTVGAQRVCQGQSLYRKSPGPVGAQRVYQGQSLCRKSPGHSGSSKSIPRTITMQEVTRSQWELKEYTKDNHYTGSHQVTVGAQRVYQGQSLCRKSAGHSGSSKSMPRTITMQEDTRSQWVLKEYAKDNHYAGSQQVTVGAQRVCQGQSLCRKSPGHSGSSKSIPRTITMQEVTRSQWELKEYTKDNHYAGSHQVTVGAQRVYQGQSLCRKSPGHSGSSKSIPRTITMQEVSRSQWELKEYAKDNHYAGSHQVTVGAQRVCQGQSLCRKSPGCLMSILLELPL